MFGIIYDGNGIAQAIGAKTLDSCYPILYVKDQPISNIETVVNIMNAVRQENSELCPACGSPLVPLLFCSNDECSNSNAG